jgi:hypothetical protein
LLVRGADKEGINTEGTEVGALRTRRRKDWDNSLVEAAPSILARRTRQTARRRLLSSATLLGSGGGGFYGFDVELQAFDFQDADGLAFGNRVCGNRAPEFAVDADHAFGAGLDW